MKTMQNVIDSVKNQELEQYKKIMEYCDTRVTADEGIPAVIGLDDLTSPWNTTYQGAKEDEEFRFVMAAGAMVFASLYEELDPQVLGEYPQIAPAMSAVAELFFHRGEQNEAVPYQKVVEKFLKEKAREAGKEEQNESV